MFSVAEQKTNEFEQVILQDGTTGARAIILPGCGGILHSFSVIQNAKAINVIESYDSETDFKTNAESKGFRNIKMSPFACRIKNAQYNFANNTYTIKKFLLNGSAIHGLLYNEPFTITNTWANAESAGVTLVHEYKGSDKGYPFLYTCTITYTLAANNKLTLTTSITNKHTGEIPLQDGWHPYFTFGSSINDVLLQFNSNALVEFDEALVPTGSLTPYSTFNNFKKLGDTFFDNCFSLKNNTVAACILKDEKQQLQIEIWADDNYPYLQIYTPPNRQSIAVENLSAAPDAFNNGMGLIMLKPATTVQFAATYKITSLS